MGKSSIDIAIDNLKGFVRKGARAKNKGFVPTGYFDLDFAISYGMLPTKVDLNNLKDYDPSKPLGLPMGRIVEVFGPEGGGKSSLCYRVAGYAQKMINKETGDNNLVAWIDTEHSFEEVLAELNGVNVDELLYSDMFDENKPEKNYYAEDVMDQMVQMCQSGVKVIILDSVANLITKDKFENSADKVTIAKLARVLGSNLGLVGHYASKYKVLVIFINQIREKPGVMFGNPETTPGGRALKHNASVRLRIAKISTKESLIYKDDQNVEGGKSIIGRLSRARLEKNRMGPPLIDPATGNLINIEIPIYYQKYFPNVEEKLFDIGRQLKMISVRKNVFTWDDVKIEGKESFIEYLKDNNLVKKLANSLKSESEKNGCILPPEVIGFWEAKGKEDEQKETMDKEILRGRPRKDSSISQKIP
ncbi:MAG TPA: hypothetical protein VMZ91_06960 [Candidatus Paceibacterota bacterium]|nr:hypothetical protein [Candidatus Paceibacterota bacterium]